MKQKIKAWLSGHKRLFMWIGISIGSLALILGITVLICFSYFKANYSNDIVFEGAYSDTSLLSLSFTERDLKTSYITENAAFVTAKDGSFACNSDKVTVSGKIITVKAEGVFVFSGEMADGMILVEGADSDKIQLVFNGFSLTSKDTPAVYIKSANKVFITTAKNTVNTLADTKGYEYTDGTSAVDAAIFSRADLTLSGEGTLRVNGNNAHGIVSKDDLVMGSGTYEITSAKKGLSGKDCVKINHCNLTISAGTDGIHSDNTDSDKGFVYIKGGQIKITATKDGIQSQNTTVLENPTMEIVTDGGSANAPVKETNTGKGKHERGEREEEAATESLESAKALKSATDIIISGGKYTIDSRDDGIHADGSIKICGGSFSLKSGDDGIHAENTLQITKGEINIEKCFEGLEAYQISISGGNTSIVADDDGVNASADSTSDFFKSLFVENASGKLEIKGGVLSVYSKGDSLDSNGVMHLTGGTVFVFRPQGKGEDIIDCDSSREVNGTALIVVGTGDSAENVASDSDAFEIKNKTVVARDTDGYAGDVIEIKINSKKHATFVAPDSFDYIVATTPEDSLTVLINGNPIN